MDSCYTLIIIDDERIIREGLRDMVDWRELGFHVAACFEDGKEALDYLVEHTVDAVLTDIKMDEVSGISVSQYVTDNLPDTKVVILSGYRDFSYAQQAVEYNVYRYLIKPVDFHELETLFAEIKTQIDDEHNRSSLERNQLERWKGLLPLATGQFFADLVGGRILDTDKISQRFHQLDLPFSLDRHPCCLVMVNANSRTETLGESVRTGIIHTIAAETDGLLWYEIPERDDKLIVLAVSTVPLDVERFESELRHRVLEICSAVKSVFQLDLDILVIAAHQNLLSVATTRPVKRTGAHQDPIIERVLTYLDKNFGREVSLSSAAERAFLSPIYFSKYIKDRTGKTFTEHLTDVRIEKAIDLLRRNQCSIGQISTLVGYSTPRYFSRVFRKQTGLGPREYRIQVLSRESQDD